DTTVVIHPLTDHRRHLPIEKLGVEITAHPDFMLVISYNPGYQTVLKDLKPSTKQRFVGMNFTYPPAEVETRIIMKEAGLDESKARALVAAADKARNLKDQGLQEVTSTRALIYAGALMVAGLEPLEACTMAIINPQTDDPELSEALLETFRTFFPER
ncbi:MAG: CbbQ/NirQ/NorQ domain-containing protein, partial [Acidithiobacillus ferriphilus]